MPSTPPTPPAPLPPPASASASAVRISSPLNPSSPSPSSSSSATPTNQKSSIPLPPPVSPTSPYSDSSEEAETEFPLYPPGRARGVSSSSLRAAGEMAVPAGGRASSAPGASSPLAAGSTRTSGSASPRIGSASGSPRIGSASLRTASGSRPPSSSGSASTSGSPRVLKKKPPTSAPNSAAPSPSTPTISLPDEQPLVGLDLPIQSTFRHRSRSRSPAARAVGVMSDSPVDPSASSLALTTSWWKDSDGYDVERKKSMRGVEGWEGTRKRLTNTLRAILGPALDITHEILSVGVDLLELAPVPGLAPAARTLLAVWDAVQGVDMNRLACLRLVDRCVTLLYSVLQEVHDAGDTVGKELEVPIAKLEDTMKLICMFLVKQNHRPFLKRYLKRDEILREIQRLDDAVRDAMGVFGLSVQIRILKQLQKAEEQRQKDTQALLEQVLATRRAGIAPPVADNALRLTGVAEEEDSPEEQEPLSPLLLQGSTRNRSSTTIVPTLPQLQTEVGQQTYPASSSAPTSPISAASSTSLLSPQLQQATPAQIQRILTALHQQQNTHDAAHDLADLRGLMRDALQTSSDAEMLSVLQIGREEMPEAIKTLQRALEKVVERDTATADAGGGGGVLVNGDGVVLVAENGGTGPWGLVRRMSSKRENSQGQGQGQPGKGKEKEKSDLERRKTMESEGSSSLSSSGQSSSGKIGRKDTLDQEFIESGIDALRRMSRGAGVDVNVPSWTITKYEVDREHKIGLGFFSDVYRGIWRNRAVAIKVLAECTPRELFRREAEIWKSLKHPHVLQLYGASSTCGDPPYFFVSPYMQNGSLVQFLKRVEAGEMGRGASPAAGNGMGRGRQPARQQATFPVWGPRGGSPGRGRTVLAGGVWENGDISREWDLWRFMHEIAKGMEYLHGMGVLHGDLKAANVLVDDRMRCQITDFGQSEMKSEAYRISGTLPPHGTLRWQAPELMSGQRELTYEMDVYAFAICCVEILTMGRMPWALMDDDAVRHFVLRDNSRPLPPTSRFNTPALQYLLQTCWHREPNERPPFKQVVRDLKTLRKNAGQNEEITTPRLPELRELEEETSSSRASPDMRPIPLPISGSPPRDMLFGSPISSNTFHTARETSSSPPETMSHSHSESTVTSGTMRMPVPVLYTDSASTSTSSIFLPSSGSEENLNLVPYDGYDSPPPMDENIAERKNERRYRLLLEHDFHPSLLLPLWHPSPIELGAVGYLRKPTGKFITLFNAFHPTNSENSAVRGLSSIRGYGKVQKGTQRVDRRTLTQRGVDAFVGLLTFRKQSDGTTSQNVGRRYSFPLRAGHKLAALCTETTEYRYVESLDAPKRWFKANVDAIMQIYGPHHPIQKEDLFLVIGSLRTPNYALFVSHKHPDGHAHFNVYSAPRPGHPWGMFTTDNHAPEGPSYDEPFEAQSLNASKISDFERPEQWNSVLLARLRFKPDVLEPTSL